MKHSLSQFLFGLKSASAPLRSDFGTPALPAGRLGVKAKQNCQSTTKSEPKPLGTIKLETTNSFIYY